MRLSSFVVAWGVAAAVAALLAGCSDSRGGEQLPPQASGKVTMADGGRKIVFPAGSPGLELLTVSPVHKGRVTVSVLAPSRVVASIRQARGGTERMILFDSPDATSLYSQFRQGRANLDRAEKNLVRARDMFRNQAATGREVTEAENDEANARAALAEAEGKLRALGLEPSQLESARPGTVWLISDVTEAQLPDVQKGEEVDIFFASFPGEKIVGRAEAVGDVIDPVTRMLKVRVSASNRKGNILPGMFARVDFGDPMDGVIPIPASALVTVEGNDYAFVESAPGEFERRQLTTRNSSTTDIVVLQGLRDGDRVVTGGAMLLKGLSFGY